LGDRKVEGCHVCKKNKTVLFWTRWRKKANQLVQVQLGRQLLNRLATNLEYSVISLNMENSWNSQRILCNFREN